MRTRDEPVIVRLSPWKAGASLVVCAGLVAFGAVAVAKEANATSVLFLALVSAVFVFVASGLAGDIGQARLIVDRTGVVVHGAPLAWEEIDAVALRKSKSRYTYGMSLVRWLEFQAPAGRAVAACSFTLADTTAERVIEAIERWWGGRVERPRG